MGLFDKIGDWTEDIFVDLPKDVLSAVVEPIAGGTSQILQGAGKGVASAVTPLSGAAEKFLDRKSVQPVQVEKPATVISQPLPKPFNFSQLTMPIVLIGSIILGSILLFKKR